MSEAVWKSIKRDRKHALWYLMVNSFNVTVECQPRHDLTGKGEALFIRATVIMNSMVRTKAHDFH